MSYGRRVALFLGSMAFIGFVLVVLFVLSARGRVAGTQLHIDLPDIPLEEITGGEN